ncbi:uncharacterized protein LOC123009940 [Tribolium madens]|uniref:uncharacterized protein LOC123009940 n=1 Tax=Tribolium madens TaxID=41895 RepID=UPI001CF756EE|nr:uncharacterized protein LOC123009940 [Tribolium madens]
MIHFKLKLLLVLFLKLTHGTESHYLPIPRNQENLYDYSYLVQIWIVDRDFDFCSGAFITQKHVITSASCLIDLIDYPEDFGDDPYKFRATDFLSSTNFSISKLSVYPQYVYPYLHNNIAILELEKRANVQPIPLNFEPLSATSLCDNVFWNRYVQKNNSLVISSTIYPVSIKKCTNVSMPLMETYRYGMICGELVFKNPNTTWEPHVDTPLVCHGALSGFFLLFEEDVDSYLFTDLQYYLPWIMKTTISLDLSQILAP